MRKAIRLASLLYPRSWSRKYGVEFESLLEEMNPAYLSDFVNVLVGALRMQLIYTSAVRLSLGFGLIGLIVAAAIALSIPNQFRSIGFMAVRKMPQSEMTDAVNSLAQSSFTKGTLARILERNDLYASQRKTNTLEDVLRHMQESIKITRIPGLDNALQISFLYPDNQKAKQVTHDLMQQLVEEDRKQSSGKGRLPVFLEPVRWPNLPAAPTAPNRPVIAVLGVSGGILLGLTTALVRRRIQFAN